MTLKVSEESAKLLEDAMQANGAMVAGRRIFDVAGAWGGHPPFVPFTFVTDGVESAVAQAKVVAGDTIVSVASANIAQQCLNAGLLDGIAVDLVPVLLGEGIRFFDHLTSAPVEMEDPHVIEGIGVTHPRYRVRKSG
jgi:hypothetical protein